MAAPHARARAVLFDLDGTLIDTLDDIAGSMNQVLRANGWPTHPRDAYRLFVGEGVQRLVESAVPPGLDERLDAVVDAFRDHYARHMLDATHPYAGVEALLAWLAEHRIPMAVLSNKPDAATRLIVERLFPDTPFAHVAGQRPDVPRKPDPAAALRIAELLEQPPDGVAFVGDTPVDVQTARSAGMQPIGVTWGFRSPTELREAGASALLDHPAQLRDYVEP